MYNLLIFSFILIFKKMVFSIYFLLFLISLQNLTKNKKLKLHYSRNSNYKNNIYFFLF